MKSDSSKSAARVLLVEDSLPVRQRIRSMIEESGQGTIVGEAANAIAAVALFREHKPDAVVLDLHLTEGSGDVVLREIKQTTPDCTVIVLTNYAIPEYREICLSSGADYFLDKSMDYERVPGVLATVGQSRNGAAKILVADDEELVGKVLGQLLRGAGYECEWVSDAPQAIQALHRRRFDLLIADVNMPGNRHLELMQALPGLAPGLPVILLTGDPTVESAAAAVRLHAQAYLAKPPDSAELKALVQESIANYRVHREVRRKWDELQSISLALNLELAVPRNAVTDLGERRDLEMLFRSLSEVVRASKVVSTPDAVQLLRHLELVTAIRETITVLEKTKRSFKSKQLGNLRARLESLVGGISLERTGTIAPVAGTFGPGVSTPQKN